MAELDSNHFPDIKPDSSTRITVSRHFAIAHRVLALIGLVVGGAGAAIGIDAQQEAQQLDDEIAQKLNLHKDELDKLRSLSKAQLDQFIEGTQNLTSDQIKAFLAAAGQIEPRKSDIEEKTKILELLGGVSWEKFKEAIRSNPDIIDTTQPGGELLANEFFVELRAHLAISNTAYIEELARSGKTEIQFTVSLGESFIQKKPRLSIKGFSVLPKYAGGYAMRQHFSIRLFFDNNQIKISISRQGIDEKHNIIKEDSATGVSIVL